MPVEVGFQQQEFVIKHSISHLLRRAPATMIFPSTIITVPILGVRLITRMTTSRTVKMIKMMLNPMTALSPSQHKTFVSFIMLTHVLIVELNSIEGQG